MEAAVAKKMEGIPRCPECDGNLWTIMPESIGVDFGENEDDGKWYLSVAWMSDWDAECAMCDYSVESGSDIERALIPYLCF
jgi:hypothetical protein